MAISCIVSETKRDIGQKLRFFIPSAFNAPSEYCYNVLYNGVANRGETVCRFDTITACDRRKDGRTDRHFATA